MTFDIESLERATLDAVAPSRVEALPGWLLPFDRSTVGRAISAVPLQHHDLDREAVHAIEARYKTQNLRAQFRIANVDGLSEIEACLQGLGYRAHQPTLTMVCSNLDWHQTQSEWTVHVSATAIPAWQSVYLANDFDPVDGANRVKALSRSNCVHYAWIEGASETIAAATVSMSQGWMSLHGLRTLQSVRGQGCATALIQTLGKFARLQGLDKCFLQVEETNTPAISLYRRFGFETAWRYRYWRKVD